MPLATPSGGIEELVDENSGKEIVTVPPVVSRFTDLTKMYEDFLHSEFGEELENVVDVLTPFDINEFLQSTVSFEDLDGYASSTGWFVSCLMRNSYAAGHSQFTLDLRAIKPINSLGVSIKATESKKVYVTVLGEAGDNCGSSCKNAVFNVDVVGTYLGNKAHNSLFVVTSANEYLGNCAVDCTFEMGKKIIYTPGIRSDRCVFKSSDKDVIASIKEWHEVMTRGDAVLRCKDNRVVYVAPDGSEEVTLF